MTGSYVVHLDPRYDPRSPCLSRSLANGDCLGESVPPGTWLWFDLLVPPRAGDIVAVRVNRPDGVTGLATKVIERAAGRLWLVSHDPPIEFNPACMVIEGTCVARAIPPPSLRIVVPSESAPPHFLRSLLRHARPALAEIVGRAAT